MDEARSRIFFEGKCVQLDFGAIGKGYAVDEMVKIAKENGITRGLVNFGETYTRWVLPPAKNSGK